MEAIGRLLRGVSDPEVRMYLRWMQEGGLSPEWREAITIEAARRFRKGVS